MSISARCSRVAALFSVCCSVAGSEAKTSYRLNKATTDSPLYYRSIPANLQASSSFLFSNLCLPLGGFKGSSQLLPYGFVTTKRKLIKREILGANENADQAWQEGPMRFQK